jgi:hypothetical protein
MAEPMRQSNGTQPADPRVTSWLEWAGRHPGVVLLGTLLLAALLTPTQPSRNQPEADAGSEDVPLFI